jgi:uncharacterized protein YqeY
MTLKERIGADMTAAMKAGDKVRLSTVRMLRAKLQEAEVQARSKHGPDYVIDDERATEVIATYAKQRRESIESYRQGGRDDLAEKEEAELRLIQAYLPEQLGADELRGIVTAAVAESGASTMKDMGAVMKLVMPQVKGRADGKLVNTSVKEALGGGGKA